MATQQQLALQMVQQLRLLDPNMSGEVGTPERKIIDTVAQALAENQIDMNVLTGAFDLDAKFGTDVDKFLGMFGFGRQQARAATGYVKFKRLTASVYDVPIARNTQVIAPGVSVDGGGGTTSLIFLTSEPVTLPAGSLEITVPVRCSVAGSIGNVAANSISQFGTTPILGITEVVNEVPTQNGIDQESDDEYKIRFKNTVFRNLAGTEDQYLALAVSTQNTTKANVVGPISRYREYIQVPDVDDATADPDSGIAGNGSAGDYTTALSTVPYSKHVYDTVPHFVSNGESGANAVFYRSGIDFTLNATDAAKDRGDTYRGRIAGSGPDVLNDNATIYQPNLTFTNVYSGSDTTVQSIRSQDILLFEHSYMSTASRNDWDRQILNCVDVFINGSNELAADAVLPRPEGTQNLFSSNASSVLCVENFRRVGQPNRRPTIGNLFTPLFWQPMTDLPDKIVTSDSAYVKNIHYWAVEDVTEIGNTVRARNGIEWATGIGGLNSADYDEGPFTGPTIAGTADDAIAIDGYRYDRNVIDLQVALDGQKQVTADVLAHRAKTRFFKLDVTVMFMNGIGISDISQQIADALNIYMSGQYFGSVIQLSDLLQIVHNVNGVDNVRWSRDLTSNRDCLVECDINGDPLLNVLIDRRTAGNASNTEVQQFYIAGGPTGGSFTLSYGGNTTTAIPVTTLSVDQATSSTMTVASTTGFPSSGSLVIDGVVVTYSGKTDTSFTGCSGSTAAFQKGALVTLSASAINTILSNASFPTASVTGSGTPVNPFVVTFAAIGQRDLITSDPTNLSGGDYVFNSDFYLQDDELLSLPTQMASGDTVAGLIVRPRAQNVWNQL